MSTTRVLWRSRIPEYLTEVEFEELAAIEEALTVGANAAQAAETRIKTGKLSSSIEVAGTPYKTKFGIVGEIIADVYYAVFQDRGTNASRVRALSPKTLTRRSTPSGIARQAKVAGRSGITPLEFMEKGLQAAYEAFHVALRVKL